MQGPIVEGAWGPNSDAKNRGGGGGAITVLLKVLAYNLDHIDIIIQFDSI
jgi:hypothetical protein